MDVKKGFRSIIEIPPMDAAIPADFRTATFGLG